MYIVCSAHIACLQYYITLPITIGLQAASHFHHHKWKYHFTGKSEQVNNFATRARLVLLTVGSLTAKLIQVQLLHSFLKITEQVGHSSFWQTTARLSFKMLEWARLSKLVTCCVVISHTEDDKASLLHINTGTWWSNTEQGLVLVAMLHFKWIVLASSAWTNVTRNTCCKILNNYNQNSCFSAVAEPQGN